MAYSYVVYTGNGATTQFTVPFPYIRKEHVFASIDRVATTAFTWVNANTVQFNTAPGNGDRVELRRVTPVNQPLVDFTDGSTLVAADLDTNALQQTYINQEQDDQIQDGIFVNAQGSLDAGNKQLKNLLDPTDPQDGATKNYVDGLVASQTVPDLDYGDITVSSGATVWTVDNAAITTAKIADANVTTAKIADANVTTAKIADANVTTAKVADANITTAKIADANVTTAKVADGAVTNAKLATGLDASKLTTGTIPIARVADGAVTNAKLAFDGGPLGTRNRIINGDMRIAQRGTAAVSGADGFPVDRFKVFRVGGAATYTAQQSGTAPATFINSLLYTVGTGAAPGASDFSGIAQQLEGFNVADTYWGTADAQPITVSFWVRSSIAGTYGLGFRNGGGNHSYIAEYTINAANTWEYKTITVPGPTSGTFNADNSIGISVFWDLGTGSTLSKASGSWAAGSEIGLTGGTKLIETSGATFYLTGVQVETGTTATPFERRHYGQELSLCFRYLRPVSYGTYGRAVTANRICFFPAYDQMRSSPTVSLTSGSIVGDSGSTSVTASSPSINSATMGSTGGRVFIDGFSGLILNDNFPLSPAGATILLSSEL
jgi:hypothetical protein